MEITPEIVSELLHYDPETGIFTWRERDRKWFKSDRAFSAWHSNFCGKRAGSIWTQPGVGYQNRQIGIFNKLYYEHRIAWMWMTDDPLPKEIDHKNRDGTDNRWINLCATSHSKNQKNMSRRVTNTSGVTGVCWDKSRGKWMARINVNGKAYSLGRFDDLHEAAEAVEASRAGHGFSPDHGRGIAHYHAQKASET